MKLTLAHSVPLAEDVYAARVRGPQAELVVNFGYGELCSLTCPAGAETGRVKFPDGDFSIYEWHLSPRGSVSYVFGTDEVDYAVRIDHARAAASKVLIPPGFGVPSGLAWWEPRFAILNTTDQVWIIDGPTFALASPEEADAIYTRAFRRITRRFAVTKGDPYDRGVYVYSREYENKTIGFIPFGGDDTSGVLAEHDGTAIDVACWRDTLFVSFEREVVMYQNGQGEIVFTPDDEEQVSRVNVIEASDGPYLAVVIGGEDMLNAPKSRVVFLKIEVPATESA